MFLLTTNMYKGITTKKNNTIEKVKLKIDGGTQNTRVEDIIASYNFKTNTVTIVSLWFFNKKITQNAIDRAK